MAFLQGMRDGALLEPVCYVWKHKYDETPLQMKASFSNAVALQTVKLHVVEGSWGCLLRKPHQRHDPDGGREDSADDFVFLEGHFAPQCRIVDSGTAAGIASIVDSCMSPHARVRQLTPQAVRLVESDALPANGKAERLVQRLQKWQGWQHLTSHCMAHRVHQAFTRALHFHKALASGLKQAALLLTHTPGNLPRAKILLQELIAEKFVYVRGRQRGLADLDAAATQHKQRCITVFAPAAARPFLFFVGAFVLNGDWTSGRVTHFCHGCCADRQGALRKAQEACNKIFSLVPPKVLSKSNWLEWRRAAGFWGIFSGMHHLARPLLERLLGQADGVDRGPPQAGPAVAAAVAAQRPDPDANANGAQEHPAAEEAQARPVEPLQDNAHDPHQLLHGHADAGPVGPMAVEEQHPGVEVDEVAALRMLEEQRRTDVLSFARLPMLWDLLFVLMKSLAPEIDLMHATLQLASVKWSMKEMVKMQETGRRGYGLQTMSKESWFASFMTASMTMLRTPGTWDHLLHSEMLSHKMSLTVLRMTTVIYELCFLPSRLFPQRLYQLAELSEGRREIAAGIIDAAACTKDPFTLWFQGLYPTVEQMVSPEATALLTSLMSMSDGHTYSTERAHSRNLRHSKLRVQTHRVDLAWLSAPHQHAACAPWAPELHPQDNVLGLGARARRGAKRKRRGVRQVVAGGNVEIPEPDPDRDVVLGARAEEEAELQAGGAPRRVKRRGAGGAWRAFLHGTGLQASPEAAAAYRNLSEERMAFFSNLGQQGTAAARTGLMGFGGMGGGAQAPLRQPPQQQCANNGIFKPAENNMFQEPLTLKQKVDVETLQRFITHCQEQGLDIEGADADLRLLQRLSAVYGEALTTPAQPYSLEVFCKLSNSWKRAKRKKQADIDGDARHRQQLISFNEQTLPGLRAVHAHMRGVDQISYPAYCPSLSASMTCSAAPPTGNFNELSDAWIQRHQGILAGSGVDNRFAGNPRAPPQSPCLKAGRCICRGQGRLERIIAVRLSASLKRLFPPGAERHDKLAGGLVIMCLTGLAPEHVDGEEGAEAPEAARFFAHISLMYLNPWRPTVVLLEQQTEGVFVAKSDANGWPACRTVLDLVSSMDVLKLWSLQILEVDPHRDSTILATDFGTLRASVSDKPAEVVWRGLQAERRRARAGGDGEWLANQSDSEHTHSGEEGGQEADDDIVALLQADSSGTSAACCMQARYQHSRKGVKQSQQ